MYVCNLTRVWRPPTNFLWRPPTFVFRTPPLLIQNRLSVSIGLTLKSVVIIVSIDARVNLVAVEENFQCLVVFNRLFVSQPEVPKLYGIVLYLSISVALLTARACQKRFRPQHLCCVDTVSIYTPKCYRQRQVKDLPKIRTWQLERDSNPQRSGRNTSTLQL